MMSVPFVRMMPVDASLMAQYNIIRACAGGRSTEGVSPGKYGKVAHDSAAISGVEGCSQQAQRCSCCSSESSAFNSSAGRFGHSQHV